MELWIGMKIGEPNSLEEIKEFSYLVVKLQKMKDVPAK